MNERPPRAEFLAPWIAFVLLLIVFLVYISLTPISAFSTPIYIVGFAAWAVLGRLILPLKEEIPGRRKGRRPFLGFGALGVTIVAVYLLFIEIKGLLPVVYAFSGFLFSMALSAALYTRRSRLEYCEHCHSYARFTRDEGEWYCLKCGSKTGPVMTSSAASSASH